MKQEASITTLTSDKIDFRPDLVRMDEKDHSYN